MHRTLTLIGLMLRAGRNGQGRRILAGTLVVALAPVAKAQITLPAPDARLRDVAFGPNSVRYSADVPRSALFRSIDIPRPHSSAMFGSRAEGSDTSSRASHGARNGFLLGAAIGFTTAYLVCDGASCHWSPLERLRYALFAAAVDGAIGALIGWKIGSH